MTAKRAYAIGTEEVLKFRLTIERASGLILNISMGDKRRVTKFNSTKLEVNKKIATGIWDIPNNKNTKGE